MFDLDGTLVDSVPDIAAAVQAAVTDLSLAPVTVAQVQTWVGNGVGPLIRRAVGEEHADCHPSLVVEVTTRFESHYARTNGSATRVYDGVFETLEVLQRSGVAVACVTNKPVKFARDLLDMMSLAQFMRVVVGGDSLAHRKPHPLPLRHIGELLEVPMTGALMVGDSDSDIAAARAAPCPIICVSYGYNHGRDIHAAGADQVVDSLLELIPLLGINRDIDASAYTD
jgi:phosphoglycolate phosphatase